MFLRELKVGGDVSRRLLEQVQLTFLEHLQHHPTYYSMYKDEHEQA